MIVKKKEKLQNLTSDLASEFHHYMQLMTSQLVLLNVKLLLARLPPTIIEPVQWFSRDFHRSTLTDDDKAMLRPDDQSNFKEWLFGEKAPSDVPSLIRSLSDSNSIRSSSRETISSTDADIDINDVPDPDDLSDLSVTSFLRSQTDDSNDNSQEMTTIMDTALSHASESSEFEGFSDDDTDNEEQPLIATSNVIGSRVEGRQVRGLDDAVIAALENSTPFTRPTRPPTEQSTQQPSDDDDDDDDDESEEGDGLTAEQRSRLPKPGEEMELPVPT